MSVHVCVVLYISEGKRKMIEVYLHLHFVGIWDQTQVVENRLLVPIPHEPSRQHICLVLHGSYPNYGVGSYF